jgi:hypothetical protein
MTEPAHEPVLVMYEVLTGVMPDGTSVMVQVFRRKGEDRSIMAQLALRQHKWQTWGPPIRLDGEHQVTESPSA